MEPAAADTSKPIRVLVVDDSFFMRKMVVEALNAPGTGLKVVETASDGLEALAKVKAVHPDVLTLDVEMPRLDGLSTLSRLMAEHPMPVVMLSSHTGKGAEATLKALELGAVDCVHKPTGGFLGSLRGVEQELVEKIRMAVLCKPRFGRLSPAPAPTGTKPLPREARTALSARFLVCVASSTGGPQALNDFFSVLKLHPLAAFLVVQHISAGFTQALARRLTEVSPLEVTEAGKGERILGGRGYVAPAGNHLAVEGRAGEFLFKFSDLPPRLGVKPSADVLMTSVAKAAGSKCAGVVLTGMGRDGTQGLRDIRSVGGQTYAQCAESCVIYGMPKSAVEAGVVARQLDLAPMAGEINSLLGAQV